MLRRRPSQPSRRGQWQPVSVSPPNGCVSDSSDEGASDSTQEEEEDEQQLMLLLLGEADASNPKVAMHVPGMDEWRMYAEDTVSPPIPFQPAQPPDFSVYTGPQSSSNPLKSGFYTTSIEDRTRFKVSRHPLFFKFIRADAGLVRATLEEHGFKEVQGHDWNILWCSCHVKPHMLQGLNRHQRINHFPRSFEITRKDKLCENIFRMKQLFGARHFDFIPETYILPQEVSDFASTFSKDRKSMWIVKPVASSRGRGIRVITHPGQIQPGEQVCVSRYVNNPLLIDGYKFDLRIYVAVTSFHPLRIYMFQNGIARLATEKYCTSPEFADHLYMHLTNYSINKKSKHFVQNADAEDDDIGNKWSLIALRRHLRRVGVDDDLLMAGIKDIAIKTLISIEPYVVVSQAMSLGNHNADRNNCFELFGFDILIDDNFRPWLLEVNLSPSLSCESPLDYKIKSQVVSDLLSLACIRSFDWKKMKQGRLLGEIGRNGRFKKNEKPVSQYMKRKNAEYNQILARKGIHTQDMTREERGVVRATLMEQERLGGYECIFPSPESRAYDCFFESVRPLNVLVHDCLFAPDVKGAVTPNMDPDSGPNSSRRDSSAPSARPTSRQAVRQRLMTGPVLKGSSLQHSKADSYSPSPTRRSMNRLQSMTSTHRSLAEEEQEQKMEAQRLASSSVLAGSKKQTKPRPFSSTALSANHRRQAMMDASMTLSARGDSSSTSASAKKQQQQQLHLLEKSSSNARSLASLKDHPSVDPRLFGRGRRPLPAFAFGQGLPPDVEFQKQSFAAFKGAEESSDDGPDSDSRWVENGHHQRTGTSIIIMKPQDVRPARAIFSSAVDQEAAAAQEARSRERKSRSRPWQESGSRNSGSSHRIPPSHSSQRRDRDPDFDASEDEQFSWIQPNNVESSTSMTTGRGHEECTNSGGGSSTNVSEWWVRQRLGEVKDNHRNHSRTFSSTLRRRLYPGTAVAPPLAGGVNELLSTGGSPRQERLHRKEVVHRREQQLFELYGNDPRQQQQQHPGSNSLRPAPMAYVSRGSVEEDRVEREQRRQASRSRSAPRPRSGSASRKNRLSSARRESSSGNRDVIAGVHTGPQYNPIASARQPSTKQPNSRYAPLEDSSSTADHAVVGIHGLLNRRAQLLRPVVSRMFGENLAVPVAQSSRLENSPYLEQLMGQKGGR